MYFEESVTKFDPRRGCRTFNDAPLFLEPRGFDLVQHPQEVVDRFWKVSGEHFVDRRTSHTGGLGLCKSRCHFRRSIPHSTRQEPEVIIIYFDDDRENGRLQHGFNGSVTIIKRRFGNQFIPSIDRMPNYFRSDCIVSVAEVEARLYKVISSIAKCLKLESLGRICRCSFGIWLRHLVWRSKEHRCLNRGQRIVDVVVEMIQSLFMGRGLESHRKPWNIGKTPAQKHRSSCQKYRDDRRWLVVQGRTTFHPNLQLHGKKKDDADARGFVGSHHKQHSQSC